MGVRTTYAGATLALVSGLVCLSPAFAGCEIGICPGVLKQPHGNDEGFKFNTSTRIYAKANVFVYETCVENISDRDMDFNWFIPGPHTDVPQGVACTNPRPMLTHKDLDKYSGCLLYGNNWVRDRGDFLPHITDNISIEEERKDSDCMKIPNLASARAEDSDNIKTAQDMLKTGLQTEVDALLPTDPKQPKATMAHVVANVTLKADPENQFKYTHTINIVTTSFQDSSPDYSEIILRPERNYLSMYSDNANLKERLVAKDAIRLPREITLTTNLDIPKLPELKSVRFELFADGRPAATLFVPYLVNSEP